MGYFGNYPSLNLMLFPSYRECYCAQDSKWESSIFLKSWDSLQIVSALASIEALFVFLKGPFQLSLALIHRFWSLSLDDCDVTNWHKNQRDSDYFLPFYRHTTLCSLLLIVPFATFVQLWRWMIAFRIFILELSATHRDWLIVHHSQESLFC